MASSDMRWKMHDSLRELDRKLNYMQLAKDYVKEKCSEAVFVGGFCLAVTGAFGVLLTPIALFAELAGNRKIEAYKSELPRTNVYEQKYADLAERVSEKTGVDEKILLGLIAGGKTIYAKELRENGYAGIVPVRPEEAGVTAETLRNDDEQCLLSAAQVFRKAAEGHTDLETVVGEFWYREKEEEAESAGDGWQFINAAINAYNDRTRAEQCSKAQESLMYHQGALAYEEMLSKLPEEEQEFRRIHGSYPSGQDPLSRKIQNPALLFYYQATIDAYERHRAGDKDFTWIDLLPVKLASIMKCSLAHMGGAKLKESGSGE
ncbi:hypothetical protein KY310_00180 [Candidatus Woesearchaeota archaeon]|nr:hypothetical protein [Candidatus Woesearchaeota archaeon]